MRQLALPGAAHAESLSQRAAREPARCPFGDGHLFAVSGEGLAAIVVLRTRSIVAYQEATLIVVHCTILGEVPRAREVAVDVHRARRAQALAAPGRAEPREAVDGAGLARVRVVVEAAVGRAPWAILGQVALVLLRPAYLICSRTDEHARLAAWPCAAAALVAGVGELASLAVTARVQGGAIGAAAVAVLPVFDEAIAANGVAFDSRGHILQALSVLRVRTAEERRDVGSAAARELVRCISTAD
mmetsp:Transcript_61692/g.155770  ORF Transcript_61692/g.155770 Transcript_61692/m.155770 type:complete len:244 (-) Transcript_61692:1281-2012(-)